MKQIYLRKSKISVKIDLLISVKFSKDIEIESKQLVLNFADFEFLWKSGKSLYVLYFFILGILEDVNKIFEKKV